MKLLFLTNNAVSAPLMEWLAQRTELTAWSDPLQPDTLRSLGPDLIVSYSYRHIIGNDIVMAYPQQIINLHISLLPYNRGADPNLWSFLENTPKGVSIHYIDAGIDTGALLAQAEVAFDDPHETLGHSYQMLHQRIQALFRDHWDAMQSGSLCATPQIAGGTFHYAREFAAIKDVLLGEEGFGITIPLLQQRYQRLLHAQA